MKISSIVVGLILLLVTLASATDFPPSEAPLAEVAFRPATAANIYLDCTSLPAGTVDVRLDAVRPGGSDIVVLRWIDGSGNILEGKYFEFGAPSSTVPGENELAAGIKPPSGNAAQTSASPTTPRFPHAEKFSWSHPGIYQVGVLAGLKNTKFTISAENPIPYAVSFQNGEFTSWNPMVREVWFWIPPNALELQLKGKGIQVYDDKGTLVYPKDESLPEGQKVALPIERRDVFWQVQFAPEGQWDLWADGFSVILSEDKKFLAKLRGGILQTETGEFVSHAFQQKAHAQIPNLLKPELVGDSQKLLALMALSPSEFTAGDIDLYRKLRGSYGIYPQLRMALEEQNLDPTSHWAGTIGKAVWEPRKLASKPEDRWDFLMYAPGRSGQGHGGLSDGPYAASLAQAYSLDRPFNALQGKAELLYRCASAALRDLMSITEWDTMSGSGADLNVYAGFPSFGLARRHFEEFALVAPHMPEEVRAPWAEGLRRIRDRYWAEGLVSTRNQSAHYLMVFQLLAEGSGDPQDAELARRYAHRFIDGMSPAGYPGEKEGASATYSGISHFYMGVFYQMTGDPKMRDALRKSYQFYNHTAAPQPDGSALAGFNFTSRVLNGFHAEQYGGARGIDDRAIPEAGLWSSMVPSPSPTKLIWPEVPLGDPLFPQLAWEKYHFSESENSAPAKASPEIARFPAESEEYFIRSFGDELIAVKRPGYYTAIYIGKPAPLPFYLSHADKEMSPLPKDGDSRPVPLYATSLGQKGTYRPQNGGGMTLFWTKDFGTSLLAAATAKTHHGLVGSTSDGMLHTENYFAVEPKLDKEAGLLTVTGTMDSLPLSYTRSYRFADDHLEMTLKLKATKDFSVDRLIENIPLAAGPAKAKDTTTIRLLSADSPQMPAPEVALEQTQPDMKISQAIASGILLENSAGEGARVEFDSPRSVQICRSGPISDWGLQHNRVEVELPSEWKAGQTEEVAFVFSAKNSAPPDASPVNPQSEPSQLEEPKEESAPAALWQKIWSLFQ